MSDSTESPSTHRMPRLSGEDILAGQEDCFQPLAADRQARPRLLDELGPVHLCRPGQFWSARLMRTAGSFKNFC